MKIFVKSYLQKRAHASRETFSFVSQSDTGAKWNHITLRAEIFHFIHARAGIFHYLFNYSHLHESGPSSAALTQHFAPVGDWPVEGLSVQDWAAQLPNSTSMFQEKHSASKEGPDPSIKLEIQGQLCLELLFLTLPSYSFLKAA